MEDPVVAAFLMEDPVVVVSGVHMEDPVEQRSTWRAKDFHPRGQVAIATHKCTYFAVCHRD